MPAEETYRLLYAGFCSFWGSLKKGRKGCSMRNLVTGQQMKAIDAYTINEIGVPSLVLQERAAWCIASEVKKDGFRKGQRSGRSGHGNNGAQERLQQQGCCSWRYPAALLLAGDREERRKNAAFSGKSVKSWGFPVIPGRM